ncbi:MAG TPA: hypothetical protein VGI82_03475 [Chitinophagaceae bacterium]|jgi:hypothetical protein
MHEVLYRYLIKYKKLDLPGIGVLALQRQPAAAEFVNHSFLTPKYFFEFDRSEDVPPEKLFSWLSTNLSITEQEAVIRFNEFLFELNRQLREGKQIHWRGIGSLQKEISGDIKFIPQQLEFLGYGTVTAEKVTRKNAEHTMLVGEREKTSTQMRELLQPVDEITSDKWWVWPLAIILAALIFLGWHFSESNKATANTVKISPADPPAPYYISR